MTEPLSQDLRRRLVRAVDEGSSAREAAGRFDVSASAAIKLVQRVRETGSTEPAKPGITLAEISAELVARGIEPGCLTTIWSTLRRLGLSHKKSR